MKLYQAFDANSLFCNSILSWCRHQLVDVLYLQVFWIDRTFLKFVLLRLVGSNQMHNFRLPNLSLLPISTKLLIQGIASLTGTSNPTCNILFISCLNVFKVYRDWVARCLLGSSTWINLYVIRWSWEVANPIKNTRVFMQSLSFACY